MGTPAQPIVNLGSYYVSGFLLTFNSTTLLTIGPGQCRDSTNTNDIEYKGQVNQLNQDGISFANPVITGLPANMTINTAASGLNGLDTGTIAASTMYGVYVVASSYSNFPTGALLSASLNGTLVLPTGYDMWRRVGFVLTDGSSHILPFWQEEILDSDARRMWYDAPISVLTATAAAAFTQLTLTPVPSVLGTCNVTLQIDLLPNAAADFVAFRPTGSSSTNGINKMSGDVAAVHHFDQISVVTGVHTGAQSIDWLTDAASTVAITVAAYVDSF